MTTTLLETSRWLHFRGDFRRADLIVPEPFADGWGPTDPLDHRHRLHRIVDAAARVPDIEIVSSALDPSTGSIRIELLAPTLSTPERQAREAQLRSADQEGSNSGTIDFEFIDPTLH